MTAEDEISGWVPIARAARAYGMTDQGVRNRIRRGTLEHRRDNHGRLEVLVKPERLDHQAQQFQPANQAAVGVSNLVMPVVETVPLALARELIAAADARTVAARRDADAEIARIRQDWRERVDAAEIRAERAEKLALDALTQAADTAERITKSLIEAAAKPLWRRFFG